MWGRFPPSSLIISWGGELGWEEGAIEFTYVLFFLAGSVLNSNAAVQGLWERQAHGCHMPSTD